MRNNDQHRKQTLFTNSYSTAKIRAVEAKEAEEETELTEIRKKHGVE